MIDRLPIIVGEPIAWVALWVVVAAILSSFPSKRHHWPLAYVLIAAGIPILVFAFLTEPATGLVGLVIGGIVLRWPVVYLFRWVRRLIGGRAGGSG